jgi:hypothetical protein
MTTAELIGNVEDAPRLQPLAREIFRERAPSDQRAFAGLCATNLRNSREPRAAISSSSGIDDHSAYESRDASVHSSTRAGGCPADGGLGALHMKQKRGEASTAVMPAQCPSQRWYRAGIILLPQSQTNCSTVSDGDGPAMRPGHKARQHFTYSRRSAGFAGGMSRV